MDGWMDGWMSTLKTSVWIQSKWCVNTSFIVLSAQWTGILRTVRVWMNPIRSTALNFSAAAAYSVIYIIFPSKQSVCIWATFKAFCNPSSGWLSEVWELTLESEDMYDGDADNRPPEAQLRRCTWHGDSFPNIFIFRNFYTFLKKPTVHQLM